MPDPNAKLAALVGSRLCHDLISPVGAIQNGLELLSLSGGASGDMAPEMSLIQDSCASAAARIRFFRIAFGTADSDQMLGAKDIAANLSGIAKGERLRAEWLAPGDHARSDVQMGFLGYLCCETALPQGGRVAIDRSAKGWLIRAEGPKLAVDPDLWGVLAGHGRTDQITPDRVQFALLSVLAETRGVRLLVNSDETELTITIC
ncbi:histidine phosphotransferase family protein [Thalassococcus lentus]|uniref:Histidine phosphotransferase family protein n=1 Tax=Thalassococcus lentus TaxID=1210524 RepID=A0ABT4XR52_9RHOB|nr:histidine phosphotransferase family protein [Thalassococcus lentus]MDA7424422.1 histidine phosphotransferase family protein [Thalassococcus lentus]